MGFMRELNKGLWDEIPVFRVVLGMCPTLAVTTSLMNGIGMGMAATFVLLCSNLAVAALRNVIPDKVRIPCFIVIAATFTTITDLAMNGFAHQLHKNLGIFIPLIVVNCIILGRAEAFAAKNSVWLSLADAIGMGIGFTIALVVVGGIRELLGNGTLTVWGALAADFRGAAHRLVQTYEPVLLMILAPGGFITLGCVLGLMNKIEAGRMARRGQAYVPPPEMDCRHCIICKWSESEPAPTAK
jgi:Na+-translocating ferredoxin:NAD+ oxidoreductase subunit E